MKFTEFELHPTLLDSLSSAKFVEATPIQDACIGPILRGDDIAGLAQTGTGKTAAYLLPLAHRILNSKVEAVEGSEAKDRFEDWKEGHFVLVLVPTRELAEQVNDTVKTLLGPCGLNGTPIYGGTSYDSQKKAINRKVEFVVATPGRLIDLFKEHVVDLNQVRAVVFDEADRMFDMGFKDDMKYLLRRIPSERQFLVFSATLNFDVLNVAYEFGSNPIEIDVSRDQAKAENVRDEIFHVGGNDKPQHLLSLIKKAAPKQAIIFSNFKNNVERIAYFLNDNGVPAMAISSLLNQSQRNRVIEQFKEQDNNNNILVATDVAARGLDVKGVDLVVNYELPSDSENYVHRIGRTGRAGTEGIAYSLVGEMDVEALERIEEYLGNKLTIGWLEDEDIIKEFKNMSRDNPRRASSKSTSKTAQRRKSGGRPSPGGKRNDSRKDSRGSRSDNRSDRRPRREARGEDSENENRTEGGSQHRDRRSGRHKNRNKADGTRTDSRQDARSNEKRGEGRKDTRPNSKKKRSQNPRRRNENQNGNGSKSSKRKVYKSDSKRKKFDPNRKRTAQKPSTGLGGKISGLVKKIFG